MKKKLNLLLIIISVLIITSACSAQKKPEKIVPKKIIPKEIILEEAVPEETVIEFMESTKRFDIETIISKIDPQHRQKADKISKLYAKAQKEEYKYLLDYFKDNAKEITYKTNDTTITGDSAIVNVKVNYIDGTPLFKAVVAEYMKKALDSTISGQKLKPEETVKIIIASIEQKELIEKRVIEKEIDIKCVKIGDEWYIEELDQDLSNVITSNILSSIEKIGKGFNSSFGKSILK